MVKNTLFLKKLEKAGFTDKEALVYLTLLELGGAFPSKIALYCKLNRSTVYKILLNLSMRGLINEIEKKNKLYYQVERPERFIKYSESKVRMAKDSLETAKRILPEIESLHAQLGEKPKITYFEGTDAVTTIYEDHFSTGKSFEMLAWVDTAELNDFLPPEFFEDYIRTKAKLGITTRGITTESPSSKSFNATRYAHIDKKIWPDIRFAPKEKFPMTGEIVIYAKNKVSIVNFSKTNAIGTIIEDEKIHNMMKTIFNLCWESSALKTGTV